MSPKQYFVSPSGSDTNNGKTINHPFRTIAKGISVLKPGNFLNLRKGIYVEHVDIKNLNGTKSKNIVIRSYQGEHAFIDGSVDSFRATNNQDWEPASLHDSQAHPDEYVSVDPFAPDSNNDRINRGAFLSRVPYTRLITYSQLDDLRADNQTFAKLPLNDPLPGPEETDEDGNPTGFRRPWVYMGPGLFFDHKNSCIHVRLSHTANNIAGLADYKAAIDPRKVRLAISHRDRTTLAVRNSSFLRFENLSIRFGGEHTISIQKAKDVVFDHVRVWASGDGVFMRAGNQGIVFRHCEFDGGLPPWFFRSDLKSEYRFKIGNSFELNTLGKNTSHALLFGNPNNSDVEMHHCEFVNAHDLYLFGSEFLFHHNWLDNLNDEALFVDAVETVNLQVHHNVMTRCLSAIGFAGNQVGGQKFIYRNLVDLRGRTRGRRPRCAGDSEVFRYGQLFKSNEADGPLDLFQNTCLVFAQDGQASYLHYRNTQGAHTRRSFNNIFIAVNPEAESDKPITFVPPPSFPGPTDGNCYFRIGSAAKPLLRYLCFTFDGQTFDPGVFPTLALLHDSLLFEQSKTQYAPGYEWNSLDDNPGFRKIAANGVAQKTDDLRLRGKSPARHHGIKLPPELKMLDHVDSSGGKPDIGCYRFGSAGLRVGVDGRRRFPAGSP